MPRSAPLPRARREVALVPAPGGDRAAHRTHKDVLDRLSRANGHLATIMAMIESGRPCLDVAQQMHAVVRALESAKATLIHDHIDHCLEAAVGPTTRAERAAMDEFKEITKYL